MNRSFVILGAAATLITGAAFSGAAAAQEFRGRGPIIIMPPQMQQQQQQMQQQMPRFQQQQPQFQAPQQRGRVPNAPQAQVQPPRPNVGNGNNSLLNAFDTNKDGTLTQEEIDTARADRLKAFDKNGDGKLSIEEYSALWLDAMHQDMVRQFQGHDTDGDGQVTVQEFDARYKDAVKRADVNGDGKLNADDLRRPAVQQQAPAPQQAPAQRPGPAQRRGAPTVAPGTPNGAPGQAI